MIKDEEQVDSVTLLDALHYGQFTEQFDMPTRFFFLLRSMRDMQ